jgi:transglutaminase-like putative cysteine protease
MSEPMFERTLQAYLDEGPTTLSDRVMQDSLRDVHHARQRSRRAAWRWMRRWDRGARAGLAAVVIVMIAVVVGPLIDQGGPPEAQARIGGVWPTDTTVVATWVTDSTTETARYLAATAYDRFEGRGWSLSRPVTDVERAAGQSLLGDRVDAADPTTRTELAIDVTSSQFPSLVFWSGDPLRVDGPVVLELVGDGSLGTITRASRTPTYRVSALIPAPEVDGGPTPARLRNAGTNYPDGLLRRYGRAAVSKDAVTTSAATALLDEIVTSGGNNPFDLAAAAERLLRNPARFAYDTDVRDLDCGDLSVVDCFAVHRRGFCAYYASTMAVLLRELDIPTRYMQGFLEGERDPVTGVWSVRDFEAHAWVQVYFPRYGWIDFDPTGRPSATQTRLPSGRP